MTSSTSIKVQYWSKKSSSYYWSILKQFLNLKKIPYIPPLLHQNRQITKYKDKVELFNNNFANQSSLINKFSLHPSVLFKYPLVNFSSDGTAKIIQKLDSDKAPGHNMISIHLIKLCGNAIYKPLKLVFRSCTENRKFSSE